MIKYFTYKFNISKYKGYRLLSEKGDFAAFKKLEYKGFKIDYSGSDLIHFEIDSRVIRRLKLLKLNDSIKVGSVESTLSRLLDKSKESIINENSPYYPYYRYTMHSSSWYYSDEDLSQNLNNDLLHKRARDKYHSIKYNQKFKQYRKK